MNVNSSLHCDGLSHVLVVLQKQVSAPYQDNSRRGWWDVHKPQSMFLHRLPCRGEIILQPDSPLGNLR